MDFTGVYHRTTEQMSYSLNESELIVNLKTGYDVKRVFLYYGDPFEAGILGGNEKWTGVREEIVYKKRLKHQIWWTTTLVPKYKRCKYYFELHTDDEVWYYFEDGFLTKEQMEMDGRMLQCFTVPWMNPADVNRTPDWVMIRSGIRFSRTVSATGRRETTGREFFRGKMREKSKTKSVTAETWKESVRSFLI